MAMLLRRFVILLFVFAAAGAAWADALNLAPGFAIVPKGSRLVVMQPDIELFELSAGGIQEPKADWTDAALQHTQSALRNKTLALGLQLREITDDEADALAEINTLHAAVARSILLHHMWGGNFALPTKGGRLDWSLGDAVVADRRRPPGHWRSEHRKRTGRVRDRPGS